MNPWAAFVLGLLIGWIIEWVIDWVFWRRRSAGRSIEGAANPEQVRRLEEEVARLRDDNEQLERLLSVRGDATGRAGAVQTLQRDDLTQVPGVDADLAASLERAGIYTIIGLSALRPARLREIAGNRNWQPDSDVEIIKQARMKAGTLTKVDNLEIIDGIGPVIARMLNEAAIFTFADLASLTAADLRALVGERIQRLADEEDILMQARRLAGR